MNFEQRVNFYLGEELSKKTNVNINEYSGIKTINDLEKHENDSTNKIYDEKLKNLLIKTNNQTKYFLYLHGDIGHAPSEITICKNRCKGNNCSVLLRCLNFDRHWSLYYNKPIDVLFEDKIDKIFWRGTTTGFFGFDGSGHLITRKGNRFELIEKFFNQNKDIDVGFSFIHKDSLEERYNKYVKNRCQPSDFLKCKYILSIEGNDKDSGINWKLNSNSLVLMPKPKITSWLMETTLIPDFHYVLLRDDFSDLEEKLIWCNNNQDKCKEIIKNANAFMHQFHDDDLETKIEEAVINKYFEIVKTAE
jgi:hypothetical protein